MQMKSAGLWLAQTSALTVIYIVISGNKTGAS